MKKRKIITFIFYSILLISAYWQADRAFALESGWVISVPQSVTFSASDWQVATHQNEMTFESSIQISNTNSTSQGFIANVATTELIKSGDPSVYIGYANSEIKTLNFTSSPEQPDGVTANINGVYTAFSGVLETSNTITFLTASALSRSPGGWFIVPTLRLTIPAQQKSGTYQCTLTFTLA